MVELVETPDDRRRSSSDQTLSTGRRRTLAELDQATDRQRVKTNAHMYILECADGSLYVGSTTHLERRLWQHQHGEGAKHTRRPGRLPVTLVYSEPFESVRDAFAREKQIQGWSRAKRTALVEGRFGDLPGLAKGHQDAEGFEPRRRYVAEVSTSSTTEVAGSTTEVAGSTTGPVSTSSTTEVQDSTTDLADSTTEVAGSTTEAAGSTTEAAGSTWEGQAGCPKSPRW